MKALTAAWVACAVIVCLSLTGCVAQQQQAATGIPLIDVLSGNYQPGTVPLIDALRSENGIENRTYIAKIDILTSELTPAPMEELLRLHDLGDHNGVERLLETNKFMGYLPAGTLVHIEDEVSSRLVKVRTMEGITYFTVKAALIEYTPPPKRPKITLSLGGAHDDGGSISPQGLLPPYQHNTYGPGVHADSTGRPFTYQSANPGDNMPVTGPVKRDGYGLGTHMDQFGRPVRDRPGW